MDQPNNVVDSTGHGPEVPTHDNEGLTSSSYCHCHVSHHTQGALEIADSDRPRHQSSAIANITVTIGYLAALISVASQCLMPRAKFIKIMFFNLLTTCTAASFCCLACYTAMKARQSATSQDSRTQDYSSDACAVSAVWLVVMIWFVTRRLWDLYQLHTNYQ